LGVVALLDEAKRLGCLASVSASRWLGASSLPVFCWHQTTAFSKSMAGKADGEPERLLIRDALLGGRRGAAQHLSPEMEAELRRSFAEQLGEIA
jgi:hypothetical protein